MRWVSLVRFEARQSPLDAAALRALLEGTAPRYRSIPGLKRKFFLSGEAQGGGLYEWESREAAEAWFTADWFADMKRRYGVEPQVEHYAVPGIVDNDRGTIEFG